MLVLSVTGQQTTTFNPPVFPSLWGIVDCLPHRR